MLFVKVNLEFDSLEKGDICVPINSKAYEVWDFIDTKKKKITVENAIKLWKNTLHPFEDSDEYFLVELDTKEECTKFFENTKLTGVINL